MFRYFFPYSWRLQGKMQLFYPSLTSCILPGYAGAQMFLMSPVHHRGGGALVKGEQFLLQTACYLQWLCVALKPKAE